MPRLEYLLPVVGGVVVSLAFFFLQKDLGPALLIACLFLAMYAVARDRYLFAFIGLLVILCGFASGYFLGFPKNVAGRVSMWLSPWDNSVRGGEQVAHSLWAFATGGAFGTGLGLGDPQWMPAAHTDLILAALGEEWGFLGVTRGACTLCRPGLVWHSRRAPCTLRLQLLPRARTHPGLRSADLTDCGRRARFNPSLRRRGSVPQLRQNRSHHQLRDHRHSVLPQQGRFRLRRRRPSLFASACGRSPT